MIINHLSSVSFQGYALSDFQNISRLTDDDLFIMSNNGESKSITYKGMKDLIFYDIYNSILGVKTMAYEPKTRYALSSHNHDNVYNRMSAYSFDGTIPIFEVISSNGTASQTTQIKINKICSDAPIEPEIGTLKLVCAPYHKKEVNLASDRSNKTFDGWVYASGQGYTQSDCGFSDEAQFKNTPAYSVFGSGSKIKIPDLQYFIKISNDKVNNLDKQNYQIGLKNHYHTIDKIEDITLNLGADSEKTFIKTHKTNDDGTAYVHTGKTWKENITCDVTINPSQIIFPVSTTDETGSDSEPHPSYNQLYVMIYIGMRTKPYTG